MAVKAWVSAIRSPGLAGVTAIETSTAAVTESVVEPLTPLPGSSADTSVVPTARLVARPALPVALLRAATAGSEELHVTAAVRSCVEPSLYVPVAPKAWSVPSAIEGFPGVTSIDTSAAAVTVRGSEPLIPLPGSRAVIAVPPIAALAARPSLAGALDTLATAGSDELQVSAAVRSCVVPSLNVPSAPNCRSVPSAIDGALGATSMPVRTAAVTVRAVEPLIPLGEVRGRDRRRALREARGEPGVAHRGHRGVARVPQERSRSGPASSRRCRCPWP